MLQIRPNCECCDRDLPPESTAAVICSFECTFCSTCAAGLLRGRCPNCGGHFSPRPLRPARLLDRYPPSPERVARPGGCLDARVRTGLPASVAALATLAS